MLHHNDERESVRQLRGAARPGIFRNSANASTTGIHEIGATLDIDRSTFEIVRHRCLGIGGCALGEFCEYFAVVIDGARQYIVQSPDWAWRWRDRHAPGFGCKDIFIARQRFQRERAEMEWPILGSWMQKHSLFPQSRR